MQDAASEFTWLICSLLWHFVNLTSYTNFTVHEVYMVVIKNRIIGCHEI